MGTTQRGQMKGVLPWLVSLGEICSVLAALVGPVPKYWFLTVHYFNSFVPIAQQAGQAAVLGRLSLCALSLAAPHVPSCIIID